MPFVAHLSNQVEAVLIRHTQVADQHVRARLGKRLDRFADAARRGDDGADLFQHQDQYPPGVGFVVYDEHAQAIETDQRQTGDDWAAGATSSGSPSPVLLATSRLFTLLSYPHRADRETNGKRRTFAFARTSGFDRPAMRFHDVFDDGKP